ncbi:unnamed protein product [Kuraishia capsulata CBS 1993]|uniref:Uncharacterized protein n=1 Tax=Kuraishia capsulata CBS 1993 TaxID=1382522 RepID=W6MLI6_9ASCO|nr:uncharacterized protein KUCA_T00002955001 [Kuraishia capsulata CBS 1993]CDK26978.1 unnamed protein product [Kuraishia capsulata CBS 1993]
MSTINIDAESEVGQRVKASISDMLKAINFSDDIEYVAEFIVVLISNGRTPEEITQELSALFGDAITLGFVNDVFAGIRSLQGEQPKETPAFTAPFTSQEQHEDTTMQEDSQPAARQEVRFDQTPDIVGLPSQPRVYASRSNAGVAKAGLKTRGSSRGGFALKSGANFERAVGLSVDSNMGDNTNLGFGQQKRSRCQAFPHCPNRVCPNIHPTRICFAFPNCPNPPGTCGYLHPGEDDQLVQEWEQVKQARQQQQQDRPPKFSKAKIIEEVKRATQGISLCKFASVCQKELCPFGHPTPANKTAKVLTFEWCPANKECSDPACTKAHPSPNYQPVEETRPQKFAPSLESCRFGSHCTNYNCTRRHATSPVLCRDGSECTRLDCYFTHPLEEECRFGINCKNAKCAFKHPEGRVLPAPKPSVWVKDGTSDRAFAVPEDQVMEHAPVQEA